MPLQGVLGLYTYLYLYIYLLPCLLGVGRPWLDGCGGLIQLWILMNPLLYDGRESRKLWMWPKSCKNVCDATAEDNKNQMSLQASASCLWEETFVTLGGQVASYALRSSSVLVFPKLRDWPQSEKSNHTGESSAMAQRQPIICLASIFSHFSPMPRQVQDREDFSSTYQKT